jgi:hypothetical protein
MKIDQYTMEELELMAPRASCEDVMIVHGLVVSRQVFRAFNESKQVRIWERLQQFDGLIPSLYAFFWDTDYLKACAHVVK